MMDEQLIGYAETMSLPEPAILQKVRRETHLTQVWPQMMAGHLQGLLLRMFTSMIRPRRILEIGTFTGYSAIAMALAPESPEKDNLKDEVTDDDIFRLHTIEANPELEFVIRKNIREAGLEERITLHIGEAAKVIPTLRENWDMVYIDADKPGYLTYYHMVFPMLRPGGFLIADNVLWDGKVTRSRDKMDKDTLGIVDFNEFIRNDPRVENVMIPFRDGLTVARKKGNES